MQMQTKKVVNQKIINLAINKYELNSKRNNKSGMAVEMNKTMKKMQELVQAHITRSKTYKAGHHNRTLEQTQQRSLLRDQRTFSV